MTSCPVGQVENGDLEMPRRGGYTTEACEIKQDGEGAVMNGPWEHSPPPVRAGRGVSRMVSLGV